MRGYTISAPAESLRILRRTEPSCEDLGFPMVLSSIGGREREEYRDLAEKLAPDVIVEDNCRSIGGKPEMTYPNMGGFEAEDQEHSC